LKKEARKQGMLTLRDSGIRKVLAGLTTVKEVLSVTFEN
jgi:type II secretory ATPase GspE/PulE/Tfp pilus assembly ATPase PilB-like protein